MRRLNLLSSCLGVLALCLGGCQGLGQRSSASRGGAQRKFARSEHQARGGQTGSWSPISSRKVFPGSPAEGKFLYTKGEDKGETVAFGIGQSQKSSGEGNGKAKNGPTKIVIKLRKKLDQYFVRDQRGQVRIQRVDNYERGVSVRFDPGMVIMPATLKPDSSHKQKVKMTVRNLDDGSVKASGHCTAILKGISRKKVKTPAGTFEAYVIHLKRKMDLSMAQVNLTVDNAYAPKLGLVASETDRHATYVGFIPKSHHERYERLTAMPSNNE